MDRARNPPKVAESTVISAASAMKPAAKMMSVASSAR
jgi:hypothetical protein